MGRDGTTSPIKVEPEILRFDSLQPGVLYVMTFSVRNCTTGSHRVRLSAPKSKYFALNYIPSGVVAPGLDVRAEVECQLTDENMDQLIFNDVIIANIGSYNVEIPLQARRPTADIKFNRLVDFGYVPEGQSNPIKVEFYNEGDVRGVLDFRLSSSSKLIIPEKNIEVEPGEKIKVDFILETTDIGPYRELVYMNVIGGYQVDEKLDISAQLTNQKLTLLGPNNSGAIETIDFGTMFYGQKAAITCTLLNAGPTQLSFNITFAASDSDDTRSLSGSVSTPQTDGESYSLEKFMTISPTTGCIKPFGQIPVLFTFNPELMKLSKGFLKQFIADIRDQKDIVRRVTLDCDDTGQSLNLSLQASINLPLIKITPTSLRFGYCPVYDRRDIIVQLSNQTSAQTKFEFEKIAQFKFFPRMGVLEGHQSITVIASFQPTQLGKFKTTTNIIIMDGLRQVEMKLVGEANDVGNRKTAKDLGGIDKLPEDFKTQCKFVDPEKIIAERYEREQQAKLKKENKQFKTIIIDDLASNGSSKENDKIYFDTSLTTAPQSLVSTHPHKQKRENARIYDDYLQTSHTARLESKRRQAKQRLIARGANDPDDPDGVDMGMERYRDEPELKLPKGGEPLWLANAGGAAGRSRMPVDENRLIQKKFSDTPATQAEVRDCSTELTNDELKQVVGSHKVLDFGKVCINSLVAKNFVVTNDLSHSVLIKLESLEQETKQSKPHAQIIPGGALTGFDIYFSSKALGKYKKSFTWSVNGIHNFKTIVLAEIVPIELIMSKTSIVMEFPEDSIEPSLTQEIFLTNPGNATAEFLWGNSGSFACKPDKGVISPGQAALISIVWTPQVGKRNEEELGLHITGGVDQILKVVGNIKEAKAQFEKPVCNIGTIAVGTEKTLRPQIRNTGPCPVVFFIDPIPENLGISINPMRGLVAPGDTQAIELTVIGRSVMSFDSGSISASIRGGKPIVLKFAGEAIYPSFTLDEENMHFGKVAVGSEYRLPMTITNKSQIAASLQLDLSQYPDFKPCVTATMNGFADSIELLQEDEFGNKIKSTKYGKNGVHINDKSVKNNEWTLTINAGATLFGSLVFSPKNPKSYNFKLPLMLQGIPNDTSFQRESSAESVVSKILISSQTVDFGDRVVSRDPLARAAYFQEIVLTNLEKVALQYEIREIVPEVPLDVLNTERSKKGKGGDHVPPLFFVAPTKGNLLGGATVPVRISFTPQQSGEYSTKLEVYISSQPDPSRPYMTIIAKGSGVFPRLSFNVPSVELPIVPLGIYSRAMFTVLNNGYSSLELTHRLSPTITVPLEITYPDGREVSMTKDRVRVMVAVKCDQPTSWVGSIQFADSDGEKFSINISGCSDQSILTNYPFVRSYKKGYDFVGVEEKPVMYLRHGEIAELKAQEARRKEQLRKLRALERQKAQEGDGAARKSKAGDDKSIASKGSKSKGDDTVMKPLNTFDGVEGIDLDETDLNAQMNSFNYMEVTTILKWLNRFVCRRLFDVDRFPQCIIESHGDIMIDCIEQMSGKKIAGIKPGNGGSDTTNQASRKSTRDGSSRESEEALAQKLVGKYRIMIASLIRSGALLNHINPVSLLSLEDYLRVSEAELRQSEGSRFTPAILHDSKVYWNEQWELNCKQGWFQILLQSLKIYFVSRISYKGYSTLPGISLPPLPVPSDPKKKTPTFPPEFGNSNVYTQSELVLLAWGAYHIQHAGQLKDEGGGSSDHKASLLSKRIIDFEQEFSSLFSFNQVIHSHVPDMTKEKRPLHGYTAHNKTQAALNREFFEQTLSSMRLSFECDEIEIGSSARTLMLTLMHLYLNVPNMIPKAKIEFKGLLGVPIAKTIELRNPSKKRVAYDVTIEGSPDFSIDSHVLILPPESCADFPVTLRARFAESTSSQITFWGVREAGVAGATMIFQLVSSITGRKAQETIRRSMSIFDMETFTINITNPFMSMGTFSIKLVCQHFPLTPAEALAGKTANLKGEKVKQKSIANNDSDENTSDPEIDNLYNNPYWITSEEIVQLQPKESRTITICMLPFMLGTYSVNVVFSDKHAGEFSYDIITEVGLPKSSEKLDFQSVLSKGSPIQRALRLSSKNVIFEKAVNQAMEIRLSNPAKKNKLRVALQNLLSNPLEDELAGSSPFVIEFTSPYFNCSKKLPFISEYISLASNMNTTGGRPSSTANKFRKTPKSLIEPLNANEQKSAVNTANSAIISFNPDKAGIYSSKVIVYARDNRNDIRIIDVVADIIMPESQMAVTFKCNARQKIIQEIPITNESDKNWKLTAVISGKGFSCPKGIEVNSKDSGMFPITFNPPYEGTFEGNLQFKNMDGGDVFDYTLNGLSEEPLAEDHLTFHCNARTKSNFSILLSQIQKPAVKKKSGATDTAMAPSNFQRFTVQTDLPYLAGPTEVDVYSTDVTHYLFSVNSPVGGLLSGSITFTEVETGAVVWYTIDIEVTAPEAESTIDVETVVRKAVAVEITLDNPTGETLMFNVALDGDGVLGDPTYILVPGGAPYELVYSPLLDGHHIGRINFINDKVGEFWYKLNLSALPAEPSDLEMIECMVGNSTVIKVPFDNPLPNEVTLNVEVSDPEHFLVTPDTVTIGPYSQSSFDLTFIPSSLTEIATADIFLTHPSFGVVHYRAKGTGCLPGILPTANMFAPLGDMGSHIIQFHNCFNHPLPIDIILNDDKSSGDSAFQLLSRKTTDIVMAPKSSLQINVSFSPKRLGQYETNMQIRSVISGRNLLWCYPIVGMAESGSPQELSKMIIKCKSSLLKDVEVVLDGIADISDNLKLEDIRFETNIDPKVRSFVNRSLRIQPLELVKGSQYIMRYRILFEPLRTFSATIDLIVIAENLGRWRVTLELESNDPDPDDLIKLTAAVGGTDKVSFKLSNRFLGYSTFQAYFSAKSSPHFAVSPSTGVLAPYGSDGTPFIVTFSPLEYGIREVATLIIATDDAQWNYEIVGNQPDHLANMSMIRSKIDTGLK